MFCSQEKLTALVLPSLLSSGASQLALLVKNLLANAGDIRDAGLIPGSGRFLGEGHGNSLQYSCLENFMDRGARRATVHRVAKSWTPLKRLSTQAMSTALQADSLPFEPPGKLNLYTCLKNLEPALMLG